MIIVWKISEKIILSICPFSSLMLCTLQNKKIKFWWAHNLNFVFLFQPRSKNSPFSSPTQIHEESPTPHKTCVLALADCQPNLTKSWIIVLVSHSSWNYWQSFQNKTKRQTFPFTVCLHKDRSGFPVQTWIGHCFIGLSFRLRVFNVFWF